MVAICDKKLSDIVKNEDVEKIEKEYSDYVSMSVVDGVNMHIYTALFNKFINSPNIFSKITLDEYPYLKNRIDTNSFVTPYEIETIINQSNYNFDNFFNGVFTPESYNEFKFIIDNGLIPETGKYSDVLVIENVNPKVDFLLSEINYYMSSVYDTDDAMRSFCDMIPDLFGDVEKFMNKFKNMKSLAEKYVGKITDVIDKFSDMSIKGMIDKLQENITNSVKRLFEDFKKKVSNMKLSIMSEAKRVHEVVAKKFDKLKNSAEKFFSDDNKEGIVSIIKAQIADVIEMFKDLDLKKIQYIIMRFCSLISTIKGFFDSKISPIKKLVQSYDTTNSQLERYSAFKNGQVMRAGGFRLGKQDYEETRVRYANDIAKRSSQENGNYVPEEINITPADVDGVSPWNDGNGDSRIGFKSKLSGMGREGWDGAKLDAKLKLMKLQSLFGKRIIVNSAYRSRAYNESLKKRGKNTAKNSIHIQGMAFDCSWEGFSRGSESQRFVELAKQCGFRGIGYYYGSEGNFIHIDLGNARSWGNK